MITLTQAQTHLTAWLDADTAVATGQSYSIGNRALTRADADEIRTNIQYWSKIEAQLQRIANGQTRTGFSVAKFNL